MQSLEKEPLKDRIRRDRDWLGDVESIVMAILLPFMIFSTICCLFIFVCHDISWLVWCSVCFLGLFSVAVLRLSLNGTGHTFMQERGASRRVFLRILAVSCAFATLTSTVLGWYVYASLSSLFFSLESRRVYVNVRPEEPAEAHSDASWLFFSEDAQVVTELSLGYLHEGTTYCVAPILGDHDLEAVQYWAVGEGCCDARGSFVCDDSQDASVKSGLAIPEASPLISKASAYRTAVEQSEAAFGLKSARAPVFLRWVADPEAVQNGYQKQAVKIIAMACVLYFVASVLNGVVLHLLQKHAAVGGRTRQVDGDKISHL